MQGYSTEGVPNYMSQKPDAKVTVPQDSASLPMFNATTTEPDAANNSTQGDTGGAK
jgi:hypothetical protein